LDRYRAQPRALEFRAGPSPGLRATRRWQRRLRPELVKLLGGFPARRCPLAARVVARRRFPEYVRETVLFQSRPDLTVFAYFLVPRGFVPPGPCVICVSGHGRGASSIVGYDEKGTMRPFGRWGEYQADFALQCVARGYAALVIEQLGFGRRRDPASRKIGTGRDSCQPAAGAAFHFGETMTAWRVWDVMRGIDYLEGRREVDPRRIGVMGISGGGLTSLFSAALEPRLKAAVVSGYLCLFRDSILSLSHCLDNYVPGLGRVAELPDVAGLAAPRAVFFESGTRDPIFPLAGVREAYRRVRRIYGACGAGRRTGLEVFRGDHRFHGRGAFSFLKREL
ncbi:MAG: alpha/beta hydrolase family protein, partial [bacterium]